MNNKIGRVSATVLGLITGIIHGVFGIIFALLIFLAGSFTGVFLNNILGNFSHVMSGVLIVVGIIVFAIALLNLIGGCIVRSSRIAGGVLMLVSSIPIIIIGIAGMWTSSLMIWVLITGLLSFTAAILAFVPYSDRYKALYVERKQRKFNKNTPPPYQPYQPQQQPPPSAPQQAPTPSPPAAEGDSSAE